MKSSHPPLPFIHAIYSYGSFQLDANIIAFGSPNAHSTGTRLSPSAGYDRTRSRFFLSASALPLDPSPVLFHNRRRICFPQGSLLHNLDTSRLFLYTDWRSLPLDFSHNQPCARRKPGYSSIVVSMRFTGLSGRTCMICVGD